MIWFGKRMTFLKLPLNTCYNFLEVFAASAFDVISFSFMNFLMITLNRSIKVCEIACLINERLLTIFRLNIKGTVALKN